VGKVVQHLQSVNCHDSRAHGQERHGPFTRLVGISGLGSLVWVVINCCNKIRYNKDIGILCLHSDRMYDNLILGIHTMSIWFGLKTGCDN
jgi:hypothetical protein